MSEVENLAKRAAYQIEPFASGRQIRKAARQMAREIPAPDRRTFEGAVLATARLLAAEDQDDFDDLSEIAGLV